MSDYIFHRHDMLFLSPNGQSYAWEHRQTPSHEAPSVQAFFPALPGICRTWTDPTSSKFTPVGFSFPVRQNGTRIRIASDVPSSEIMSVVSPWDILPLVDRLPATPRTAIRELACASLDLGLPLGIFGSAALQALTCFPYLHETSDIDVLLPLAPPSAIQACYTHLVQLEQRYSMHIDAELMVSNSCYVKLHELIRNPKTILAKGAATPTLLSCQTIWDTMAALPQ